ncbi:hypothetical protein GKQ38_02910 [Candidatus Nanohaloarchaea archaeon]|nr:hypothetical protein GKQ38_02910 [Candidatus Nanohaloarchaea archaeon]
MAPIRFDIMGALDFISGILLLYTVSPVPESVAMIHAGFLIFKGAGSMINSVRFPFFIFILGGFADLISASILFYGKPPILMDHKIWISGLLFLKGVWSMLGLMSIQSS